MNHDPENTYAIPEPSNEIDDPNDALRDEWIHERDADLAEMAMDAEFERRVDDELVKIVIPDIALLKHQAGEDA